MRIDNRKHSFIRLSVWVLLAIILVWSCRKEDDIITESSAKLRFSVDSVLFDTVFTTLGTATKQLKVYNPHDKKIVISSIKLAEGNNSNFTINVDGTPALNLYDIEIPAKDSIFIFIRATIDPNNQNSPLIIHDSIEFVTNGNKQDVDLIAWGQDAHYHVPAYFSENFPAYSIVDCNDIWVNDKPHVVFGYLVVDSACSLTIQEGVQVHLHEDAVLWVYKDGTLKVNGQKDNEVVFQGDRLEEWYEDLPGQWGRIWLSAGSKDNEFNYAIIRNGVVGIHVDTLGNSQNPTLKLKNTIIENMSFYGLLAQGSHVEAENCVFANCGEYAVFLNIGGEYDFKHCTFANYWLYSIRQVPLLRLNNYYEDIYGTYQVRDLTKATFANCIIYGNNSEELSLDKYPYGSSTFNYSFDHVLIHTERNIITDNNFTNCLSNLDPLFENYTKNNYELQEGSPAIDAGNPAIGSLVPIDLNGEYRDGFPDLGAYEYVD